MNPYLAFVLLGAVGYFGSSVVKTQLEERFGPTILFKKIVEALDQAVRTEKFVEKRNNTTYMIWPVGIIGGVSYNGSAVTYIQPVVQTQSFIVTTFNYQQKAWVKVESVTLTCTNFLKQLSHGVGLPSSLKTMLLSKVGGPVPERPPHRSRPPW